MIILLQGNSIFKSGLYCVITAQLNQIINIFGQGRFVGVSVCFTYLKVKEIEINCSWFLLQEVDMECLIQMILIRREVHESTIMLQLTKTENHHSICEKCCCNVAVNLIMLHKQNIALWYNCTYTLHNQVSDLHNPAYEFLLIT